MMKNRFIGLVMIAALATLSFPIYSVHADETLLWLGEVSSNGIPVTTPTLELGFVYHIHVAGCIILGPSYGADAQYYYHGVAGWWWPSGTRPDSHSFLQINDLDYEWGPFNNGNPVNPPWLGHTYDAYYVGQGVPIELSIHDWFDGIYENNYCHFLVYIYYTGQQQGYSPGFWKRNIEIALGLRDQNYNSIWGVPITYNDLLDWVTTAGYTLNSALDALKAKGHGSDIIRLACANTINAAAGLSPYP